MTVPEIRTERLVLRAFGLQDIDWVTEALQDFEVVRWLTNAPHPYTRQDAETFLASRDPERDEVWAITEEGRGLGLIGLERELGYWLARPNWGRGIMKEATAGVLGYWGTKGEDMLLSGHFLRNERSRSVLLSFGFVPTQVETVTSRAQGKAVELQSMVLTRAAWEARAAKPLP